MKRMLGSLLLAGLFCLATSANAAQLTEASVLRLIASMEESVETRDVAAIAAVMSDDIEISVTLNQSVNGRLMRMSMSKSEYLKVLKAAWGAASEHRYKRSNQTITLRGDQAIVVADVNESMTIDGRTQVTSSHETTTIELVNGKLQAVAISAFGG